MAYEFKREPLTPTEQDRLTNSCESFRERLLVYTLLDTGLRVSEVCKMKKDNIQWQQNTIVVWGKGKKRRVVPMSKRVKELLQTAISTDLITNDRSIKLGDRGGGSSKTAERMVTEIAGRAKITKEVTPHVLRHTFAVRALEAGVNLVALQKILGHADLMTTKIYLNITNEDALDEYRRKVG